MISPDLVVTPRWFDPHTHLLFAGDRSDEFLLKAQGASYLEIAQAGGGIKRTVTRTEEASDTELQALLEQRLQLLIDQGVGGVEIKASYSFSEEHDLRHLRLLKKIQTQWKPRIRIWVTAMPAHGIPKNQDKKAFLKRIVSETLPSSARDGLADFFDLFIDEGFYDLEDAKQLFSCARSLGFKLKAHVDELRALGAATVLAEDYSIVSIDHCLKTSPEEMAVWAQAGTVPVFLMLTV